MKKAITALSAVVLLAACNPATGPGNKEPVNDGPIEEQNYRGNDTDDNNMRNDQINDVNDRNEMNDHDEMNERNDNKRNRRQMNDDHLGPNVDNMQPKMNQNENDRRNNDKYPNDNMWQ